MDKSLDVFRDSFHSFYFLGFKNAKTNGFGANILRLQQIEVQVFTNWSR